MLTDHLDEFIISIHALAKRATRQDGEKSRVERNFNPRPRKEGDQLRLELMVKQKISIHALAKRATMLVVKSSDDEEISIHALAKRATKYRKPFDKRVTISIHALAKRATAYRTHLFCRSLYFNPRPRKEGDIVFEWRF